MEVPLKVLEILSHLLPFLRVPPSSPRPPAPTPLLLGNSPPFTRKARTHTHALTHAHAFVRTFPVLPSQARPSAHPKVVRHCQWGVLRPETPRPAPPLPPSCSLPSPSGAVTVADEMIAARWQPGERNGKTKGMNTERRNRRERGNAKWRDTKTKKRKRQAINEGIFYSDLRYIYCWN